MQYLHKIKSLGKICVLSMAAVNSAVFCTVFPRPQKRWKKEKYDCAIVCGCGVNPDGTPSGYLKTRVEKAAELWRNGKVNILIMSGAAVQNEFIEAEAMKEYAVTLGIPEEVILEEKKAVSTYHNLLYSKEKMQEQGFKDCVVVTNGWHLRKANHYAKKFKLDYVMSAAKNPVGETICMTLWRYVSVNLHMYFNMFRGYW